MLNRELVEHHKQTKNELLRQLGLGPFPFVDLLWYKENYSTQRVSAWFQKEQARLWGLNNKLLKQIDATDNQNATYEFKYASVSKDNKIRFPQMIRLNVNPDWYIISIFESDRIMVSKISGENMHNSVFRIRSKDGAHAESEIELQLNFSKYEPGSKKQRYSECYNFLINNRNIELENIILNGQFQL